MRPAAMSREGLAAVLARTLEEAAFVFTEEAEAPPPALGERAIAARITFAGPGEGELTLTTSAALAATLAANLLGEDEGGAEVVGDDEDAVGEVLNMIAGAWAVEAFGDEVPCRLGLPRVAWVTKEEHAAALAAADATATLLDEEGRRIDLSGRLARGGAGA